MKYTSEIYHIIDNDKYDGQHQKILDRRLQRSIALDYSKTILNKYITNGAVEEWLSTKKTSATLRKMTQIEEQYDKHKNDIEPNLQNNDTIIHRCFHRNVSNNCNYNKINIIDLNRYRTNCNYSIYNDRSEVKGDTGSYTFLDG